MDPDLRVKPFFAQGGTDSIQEFIVGAFTTRWGCQAVDPILTQAAAGARMVAPTGMVLDGSLDLIQAPLTKSVADDLDGDGVRN